MLSCVATLFYQHFGEYATPQGKIFSLFSLSTPEGDFLFNSRKDTIVSGFSHIWQP